MKGARCVGEGIAMLALSMIFLFIPALSFFFLIPLLAFSARHGENRGSVLIGISMLASLAGTLLPYIGKEFTKLDAASVFIALYFPLSLSAAGIIWLKTRGDHRLISRLLKTLIPALLLAVSAALLISSDRALPGELAKAAENAFAAELEIISSLIPGIDASLVIELVIITVLSVTLPAVLCGVCADCFIYEALLHSRESGWDDEVTLYEFPPDAVWGFILSWGAVLAFRFISATMLLEIAVINIAGVWSVLYAIQGFAVIANRIRHRHREMRTLTILIILVFLLFMLPGINLIILIGLPILGVLETFFYMKKRGVDYEDHS